MRGNIVEGGEEVGFDVEDRVSFRQSEVEDDGGVSLIKVLILLFIIKRLEVFYGHIVKLMKD